MGTTVSKVDTSKLEKQTERFDRVNHQLEETFNPTDIEDVAVRQYDRSKSQYETAAREADDVITQNDYYTEKSVSAINQPFYDTEHQDKGFNAIMAMVSPGGESDNGHHYPLQDAVINRPPYREGGRQIRSVPNRYGWVDGYVRAPKT